MKKTIILFIISAVLNNVMGAAPDPIVQLSERNHMDPEPSFKAVMYNYPVKGYFLQFVPNFSNALSGNYALEMNYVNTGDAKLSSAGRLGYSFSAGYFRAITPQFKLLTGIGIDKYDENISENTLENLSDMDNDLIDYYHFIPSDNWKNNHVYLSIPLLFEYGKTDISKLSFYFNFGINFSYLVNKSSIESNNSFSTISHYGEELGYVELKGVNINELDVYMDRGIETNPFQISLMGGAGVTYPFLTTFLLKVGVVTNYGLSDVYSDIISSKLDHLGFTVGLYYYLGYL